EVCAELWAKLLPPPPAGQQQKAQLILGLFTKGPITLQRKEPEAETLELPAKNYVVWHNGPGVKLLRSSKPGLPPWWDAKPDVKDDRVADALISLKDWSGQLSSSGELLGTIQKSVNESQDPGFRYLGMYFLAALSRNGAAYLASHLADPQHA